MIWSLPPLPVVTRNLTKYFVPMISEGVQFNVQVVVSNVIPVRKKYARQEIGSPSGSVESTCTDDGNPLATLIGGVLAVVSATPCVPTCVIRGGRLMLRRA